VHATADFLDYLILIDELAARERVRVD
jgi:hypothetical protein